MRSTRFFTDAQTLQELQFPSILEELKSFTVSKSAAELTLKLKPSNNFKKVLF